MFETITTSNKLPILFRQYHRNIVYKIEWVKLDSEYYLFSCSERELVAFKKSEPDAGKKNYYIVTLSQFSRSFVIVTFITEPMSIIRDGCTEFSWKSNVCLAIALENGYALFNI